MKYLNRQGLAKTLLAFLVPGVTLAAGCSINPGSSNSSQLKAIVYKSPTCGCCVSYVAELEKKGYDIETKTIANLAPIKSEHGIPSSMESCHTMIIEGYFVEGHVPIEAVEKLLEEKPDIDGIALPRMPAGSPGMPGTKNGPFIIYSLKDRQISEYTRV